MRQIRVERAPGVADDRVTSLLDIAHAISSDLDFRTLLKVLAQKTAQMCGADRCAIYLVRDGHLVPAMSQYASGIPDVTLWRHFRSSSGLRLDDFPGFKRALESGAPVVFSDPAGALPSSWIDMFHISSGLILPLVRGRRWVGVVHLNNSESSRPFENQDVQLARAIGVQLTLVIDNAHLVEETRSRLRDTETLLSVGQTINSTLDLMEVVRQIARATANALDADSAGVFLMSESGTLEPLAGYHVPAQFRESAGGLQLEGFRELGTALRTGSLTLWSDDVPNDPRFAHEVFRRLPLQSILIANVHAKSEMIGTLVCAWWTRRRRFSETELGLVRAIAAQAAIAITNARLYAKAEESATNRERVRVAHELHDRLSQSVFSLGLRLEWCLRQTPRDPPVHAKLGEAWEEARSIMSQMRHLIYRLSPDAPAEDELPVRLQKLVDDFRELSGITVSYEQRSELTGLSGAHEDVLFKTLQEALANIVKHASATRVSLVLDVRDGVLTFALQDDGVGAAPGFLGTQGCHGLRHMMDRIEAAGGRVEVGPTEPSGFVVRGCLPLQP